MAILELEEVSKFFGGLAAVSDLNFSVSDRQEILGLIGPNGAGKTTVFNLITGLLQPSRGKIRFQGTEISGEKPYRISATWDRPDLSRPPPCFSKRPFE